MKTWFGLALFSILKNLIHGAVFFVAITKKEGIKGLCFENYFSDGYSGCSNVIVSLNVNLRGPLVLILIATSKTSRVSKRRIHLINQFCFVKYLNGMPFEVFHKSWRRTEKAQKMNFGIAGPRVRHSKRRTSKRLH